MALKCVRNERRILAEHIGHIHPDSSADEKLVALGRNIVVNHASNFVGFRIQNGPIKEMGVNGCQIDHVLAFTLTFLKCLNAENPNAHSKAAIKHIELAMFALRERARGIEKRAVEGLGKL